MGHGFPLNGPVTILGRYTQRVPREGWQTVRQIGGSTDRQFDRISKFSGLFDRTIGQIYFLDGTIRQTVFSLYII